MEDIDLPVEVLDTGAVTVYSKRDGNEEPGDELLCGQVGAVLNRHYPGFAWVVEVPTRQGVVIVRNLDLEPSGRFGFVIKRALLDSALARVVMAGGEMLERWRVARMKMNPEEILARQNEFRFGGIPT